MNFKGENSIKEMYQDYHGNPVLKEIILNKAVAKFVYDELIKLQPYVKECEWAYTGGGCYHFWLHLSDNSIITINGDEDIMYSSNNWESIHDYTDPNKEAIREDGVPRWGFETDGEHGFSSCVNETTYIQARFKMYINNLVTNITNSLKRADGKVFFLFGSDAVTEYEENGVDGVISQYEDNELGYETYEWTEGDNPWHILNAFKGMWDFVMITEEEFNKLN